MYVIDEYQLIESETEVFLSNFSKAIKVSNTTLKSLLSDLKQHPKLEITEEGLGKLAQQYGTETEVLKTLLIQQLKIIKPLGSRKFPAIYFDVDDELINDLVLNTFSKQYNCSILKQNQAIDSHALIIFYRNNYSHVDFKKIHNTLPLNTYLITAGLMHKLLIIDNLYFKNSGLPTHFSNLHQLIAYFKSDIPATKNNWLLFYRELLKNNFETFPDTEVNDCQRGFIAYCLHQFMMQFTNLWCAATPLDKINWFWQIDLSSFTVHQEVAIHSPFSEMDMRIQPKLEEVTY